MKLLLGVTGSISAYKAVDLLRIFQKNGHPVSVVLTRSALRFIPALPFETFSPGRVFQDMFASRNDPLPHIELARANDLLLIAPATANIIGKMANGIADDLLSTLYLAFSGKVAIAPAMNDRMLVHPAVTENLSRLKARGVLILDPEEGVLASGDEGRGRLPAPERIYRSLLEFMNV